MELDMKALEELNAKYGAGEVCDRLLRLGSVVKEYERELGRKLTPDDWKNLAAVAGGQYENT
jgi:hypothetical protein